VFNSFGTEDLSCTTDYPLTNNRASVSIYSKRIWRVKISLLTEGREQDRHAEACKISQKAYFPLDFLSTATRNIANG